ncbi:MAG: hypothetical protein IK990_12720 [Ruminiclostridium sp.]|nr:hypothetical protein [Ruminiclostridium sp.]
MTDDNTKIVFIGGDKRMIYAAKRLADDCECAAAGFELIGDELRGGLKTYSGGRYDIAVLPVFAGGTKEIRCPFANRAYDICILPRLLKGGGIVFAGNVFPELTALCDNSGFTLYDYLTREELAIRNARLTAEGAVMTAISETESSVHGSEMLVIGFGRIGKLCAGYFAALGADVTVAARRLSDRVWAESYGYGTVDITDSGAFDTVLAKSDIIVNTAPAKVLAGESAAAVRSCTLLIELASVPCTDGQPGFRIVNAGGLPGKTAPAAAGAIIADTIKNILTERSNQNE